jgi:DNA modification methylase
LRDVLTELHRVLRPGGQLYVWMGTQYLGAVLTIARQVGFRSRAKLVAVKARPQPSWRRQNFRSCYEECLCFSKGRPVPFHFTNQEAMGNVFTPPFEPKASAHPTEKRPAMLQPLIEASSNPGDLVLDPFLGSGSTAVVAASLGRDYLGFEQNARYLAMARARLQENEKGP